jgi:hypothetical protein
VIAVLHLKTRIYNANSFLGLLVMSKAGKTTNFRKKESQSIAHKNETKPPKTASKNPNSGEGCLGDKNTKKPGAVKFNL